MLNELIIGKTYKPNNDNTYIHESDIPYGIHESDGYLVLTEILNTKHKTLNLTITLYKFGNLYYFLNLDEKLSYASPDVFEISYLYNNIDFIENL